LENSHFRSSSKPLPEQKHKAKEIQAMKRNLLTGSSRLPAFVLIATCLTLAGVALTVSALKGDANNPRQDEIKRQLQILLASGIGKQVRLDKVRKSPGQVRQAVADAAQFIRNRSGLTLSEGIKTRLAEQEQATIAESNRRITINDLVEILTATAVERLASLSDDEIAQARAIFLENGDIYLRASGRGPIETAQFDGKVKEARELSRRGDEIIKGMVRAAVREEVTSRVDIYSEALPNHFGGAKQRGLTPLQAVLITYSVVSDDFMFHSQSTLNARQELVYERMHGQGFKQGRKPNKAYGSDGYLYTMPLDLILNETTLNSLLDRIADRGGNSKMRSRKLASLLLLTLGVATSC
jgi:hypothetical protein